MSLLEPGLYTIKVPIEKVAANPTWLDFVEASLPPTSKSHTFRRGNLLKAIETGRLEVWALYRYTEKEGSLLATYATARIADQITGDVSLVIYSLTTVKGLTRESFIEAVEKVKQYAESVGAVKIVAYFSRDFASIAEKLGAQTFSVGVLEV